MMRYLIFLALCIIVVGCKSVQYVPIEIIKNDSIYITKVKVDSIKEVDSVFVNQYIKGDTTYIEKYRYVYRYKDKVQIDTMLIERVDSVSVPYPIERKLSKWETFKQDVGGIALGVIFALVAFIIWMIFFKKKIPKNA